MFSSPKASDQLNDNPFSKKRAVAESPISSTAKVNLTGTASSLRFNNFVSDDEQANNQERDVRHFNVAISNNQILQQESSTTPKATSSNKFNTFSTRYQQKSQTPAHHTHNKGIESTTAVSGTSPSHGDVKGFNAGKFHDTSPEAREKADEVYKNYLKGTYKKTEEVRRSGIKASVSNFQPSDYSNNNTDKSTNEDARGVIAGMTPSNTITNNNYSRTPYRFAEIQKQTKAQNRFDDDLGLKTKNDTNGRTPFQKYEISKDNFSNTYDHTGANYLRPSSRNRGVSDSSYRIEADTSRDRYQSKRLLSTDVASEVNQRYQSYLKKAEDAKGGAQDIAQESENRRYQNYDGDFKNKSNKDNTNTHNRRESFLKRESNGTSDSSSFSNNQITTDRDLNGTDAAVRGSSYLRRESHNKDSDIAPSSRRESAFRNKNEEYQPLRVAGSDTDRNRSEFTASANRYD